MSRPTFDPYAAFQGLEQLGADEDLEEPPRAPRGAPALAPARLEAPAPAPAPERPPLERTRLGEDLVIRLLAVARRSGRAKALEPKASGELMRLRLELLAFVVVAGAELDVRGLVRVLAPGGAAGEDLVGELERLVLRAEQTLPALERGTPAPAPARGRARR